MGFGLADEIAPHTSSCTFGKFFNAASRAACVAPAELSINARLTPTLPFTYVTPSTRPAARAIDDNVSPDGLHRKGARAANDSAAASNPASSWPSTIRLPSNANTPPSSGWKAFPDLFEARPEARRRRASGYIDSRPVATICRGTDHDRRRETRGRESDTSGKVRRSRILHRRRLSRNDDFTRHKIDNPVAVGIREHPTGREGIGQMRCRRGGLRRLIGGQRRLMPDQQPESGNADGYSNDGGPETKQRPGHKNTLPFKPVHFKPTG